METKRDAYLERLTVRKHNGFIVEKSMKPRYDEKKQLSKRALLLAVVKTVTGSFSAY